jgi:RNA polymerase sigma-70 factor (ECF subfamily)
MLCRDVNQERAISKNDLVKGGPITGSGRTQAFEEIFQLHHRRVYSLCLRMIGNSTEAGDLTQDVFVQVFRTLGSFRGESAFTTWLHRLTVNQVLMHFRKNQVRKRTVN